MLNYIWIALIVLGILVAAGHDFLDEQRNPYRNGFPIDATIELQGSPDLHASYSGDLSILPDKFNSVYGTTDAVLPIHEPARLNKSPSGETTLTMHPGESSPKIWREMAGSASSKGTLTGRVTSFQVQPGSQTVAVQFVLEPIRFVKLRAVTEAAFDSAILAVNIAIGLIGIMALWLGVMKVAEAAGAMRLINRALKPLMRRLFPDVPADHPAVSSMVMNIAANMLGLSNAATPFGLKAMEELNSLSPKLGAATNAMCTFLAINTGGFVLIPATALAVRAAAGSANPGIIIGTSMLGATCATVAGVVSAKLLQRLPHYRKALEADNG